MEHDQLQTVFKTDANIPQQAARRFTGRERQVLSFVFEGPREQGDRRPDRSLGGPGKSTLQQLFSKTAVRNPQPTGTDCPGTVPRSNLIKWRRERDSNPRYGFPYIGFQDRLFQPLTHPSAADQSLSGDP
jgi:hypothetical protein